MHAIIRSAGNKQKELIKLLEEECFTISTKKIETSGEAVTSIELRSFYPVDAMMHYTGCDVLVTKENEIIILIVKDEDLDYGKLFESRESAASVSIERN